ncbi:hypothetical protein PsYK624_068210 [Phanerochaete sordida]|uniref:BTB domain-containing protein n=1 Tax=Phanerochaete sordida TaxID=48140 RepID=A0A9P3G9T1_9APHY|nr:hypothetical protein PsYK624_068210 [Phanerochaete sordida]
MQAASPPFVFDIAHADMIIRSSDGTDFPMYKVDLVRSSPIFETMFALPQPDQGTPGNGLPVIDLTESAAVLQVLLRFSLPRAPPALNDLSTIGPVLEAARKYELAPAGEACLRALERAVPREPLRVYAIACTVGIEPIVRLAARTSLRVPLAQLVDTTIVELESTSGEELRRLIKYRHDCARAAESLACLSPSGYNTSFLPADGSHDMFLCSCTSRRRSGGTGPTFPQWWNAYRQGLRAKLQVCPWEGAVRSQDAMQAFLSSGACQPCSQVSVNQVGHAVAYVSTKISEGVAGIRLEFDMRSGTLQIPARRISRTLSASQTTDAHEQDIADTDIQRVTRGLAAMYRMCRSGGFLLMMTMLRFYLSLLKILVPFFISFLARIARF